MVYQESDNTCGNSCVRNILNLVFKKDKYNTYYIKENLDSFAKIENELSKNGLSYQGYKTNNISLLSKKKLPAIMQIYNGTKFHFVVLYSIGKKYAKIIDPQFGKLILPVEELKFIFTGRILLFEEKTGKIIDSNNIQFINISISLKYVILSLIQLLSTYFLFYNITTDLNINYILLFGSISFLSIILHNILNFSTRVKLNKILDIFSEDSCNKDDIISLSKVLDNEVVLISTSLNYLVAILLCIFLLCNSLYDSIIPLLSIVAFILKILLTPFINNIKREIFYFEDIAFSHLETDKTQFNSFMKKSKKRSFKFLLYSLLPYIFLFLLIVLYSSINHLVNPTFSISKFLFIIFISFFIYSLLDKFFQSLNKKDLSHKELNKMTLSIKSISLKKKTIIYYNNIDE